MNKKITDLPLKTTSLAAGDLFEVSEDQGAGVFISKKIEGSQLNNKVQSVTGLNTDNTDPLNPIVEIAVDGVTVTGDGTPASPLVANSNNVQSVTGLDTDNTDPLNPVVEISVDGSTITGSGTPASPLVANSNFVNSVTGLNTDNTDPLNPVVQIAVDGVTVTGDGTAANPLIAPEQYLWLTLEADTGSAIVAGSPIAALTIAGANGITTNTTGTTLTITGSGGSNPFTYEIGQYVVAEGGVIAHRWLSTVPNGTPTAGTIQNYLVVALTDVGGTYIWGATGVTYGASSMFNGQLNTSLIAALSPTSAAAACDTLVSGGKSDWYLPATDEWRILFDNRWAVNQGLITFGLQIGINLYFTSTETSSNNALSFQTIAGVASDGAKVNTYAARAVRRFSI